MENINAQYIHTLVYFTFENAPMTSSQAYTYIFQSKQLNVSSEQIGYFIIAYQ